MKTVTIAKTEYSADKEVLAQYVSMKHTYDDKGRIIEENELDEEGNTVRKATYEYSPKGNVSLQVEFDETGEILQQLKYEENAEGEIIKQTHIFSDGSHTVKAYELKTGESGYTADVLITDEQGQVLGKELLQLDDNDNILLAVEIDEEGNENNKLERSYTEEGKLKEEAKYFSGEIEYIKRFTYTTAGEPEQVKTLDGEGNVLGVEDFTYNEKGQQLENKIENRVDKFSVQKEFQWDEKGNIILTLMYRDGKLIYQSKNEYNEENDLISEDIIEIDWRAGRVERHEKMEYRYGK